MFYRFVSPTPQNLLQTSLDTGVSYFNPPTSFFSAKIKVFVKHIHFCVSDVCRICNLLFLFSRNFGPTQPYTTRPLTKNAPQNHFGVSFLPNTPIPSIIFANSAQAFFTRLRIFYPYLKCPYNSGLNSEPKTHTLFSLASTCESLRIILFRAQYVVGKSGFGIFLPHP